MYRSADGTTSYTQMTNASGETYASGTTTVITAAATGTIDVTLATPSRGLEFRMYARAANNPTGVAHIHGMMYDVTVYTETGTINGDAIVEDVVALCTDLNSTVDYVAGPTLALPVFATDGWRSYAEIISKALNFGDSSGNNYAAYLRESDRAGSAANGKPVLVVEQFPAITSVYEYEINLADKNLVAPFTLDEDNSQIQNYIPVSYTDAVGSTLVLSPADNASLTDTTSTGRYGRRLPPGGSIDAGIATAAQALDYGERYLARYKNAQWRISSPISVVEYIRKAGEIRIPCANIRAGQRVLFSNFPASPTGSPLLGASPLIAIISSTSYDDDNRTCSMTFGDISTLW
jgi:hypothetical protein